MAQNDGQERTEEATPKRLRESREKGQVARSRELSSMAMLLSSAAALLFMGEGIVAGLLGIFEKNFTVSRERIFDPATLPNLFLQTIFDAVLLLAPLFVLLTVVAVFSSIAISGWNFSSQALAFKWEKLDPVKGMGRIFAARGLIELLKALAKFLLIGSVAVFVLWSKLDAFLHLGDQPVDSALAQMANLLLWSFLAVSLTMILMALLDVPFQLWDHARQLKMSRQEIKDEHKQTEGNPEVRGRIRQLQREMAQRRMMSDVPDADVIVTNPTHYAVALKYDQQRMGAPKVVAMGADLVAAQIRAVGAENNVPVLSAPPLARALYHNAEIGQEIPAGLYQAVAQVLAYLFHLNNGGEQLAELNELPIPEELQHD
ncbi:MAG TPA: flagellar type III secretion system protein FlhB [Gammaproteobacteria bacterium]|nr:flagellar type III secretion system protein FlhB [Gammaproteobacteria bacterium]